MSEEKKEEAKVEKPASAPKAAAETTPAPASDAPKKDAAPDSPAAASPQAGAAPDSPAAEKKETPKKEKPSACVGCKKSIKKKRWYYRDGKYYCTKRCWNSTVKKAEKKDEAPAAAA